MRLTLSKTGAFSRHMRVSHFFRSALAVAFLLTAAPCLYSADISFSGASGSPIVFSINSPISYTVTASGNSIMPAFVFKGTNQTFPEPADFVLTGNAILSINGVEQAITDSWGLGSGINGGGIDAGDLYLVSLDTQGIPISIDFHIGDIITLSDCTLKSADTNAITPFSGRSTSIIVGGNTETLATMATENVPEPSDWALLSAGVAVLGAVGWRKRRACLPAA